MERLEVRSPTVALNNYWEITINCSIAKKAQAAKAEIALEESKQPIRGSP
ncbi:MAG: hypothetical protein ACRC2R_27435 [Xenococcaceae cyanobacterium]